MPTVSVEEQKLAQKEISLIQELIQTKKAQNQPMEYESFEGYELPPRTQFSMLKKPAVSIKYGQMTFNMACIRLFEGIQFILPLVNTQKKRLAVALCQEEESSSVEWARLKNGETWVNKTITSLEFIEQLFLFLNWDRECRYKVLGRLATSDRGLILVFDLEEAIMFTPDMQEYVDHKTGEVKKRQVKYFPDQYKDCIGKSYNDYEASRQLNIFEDIVSYDNGTPPGNIPQDEAGSVGEQPSTPDVARDEG